MTDPHQTEDPRPQPTPELEESGLPSGWVGMTVNDVHTSITNFEKVKTKDYLESGLLPVIDQGKNYIGGYSNEVNWAISSEKPVTIFGDHTRCLKFVDFDFIAGADGTKILVANDFLDPKLFHYFLQAIELPDRGYGRHFKLLQESFFPLPPLPEQIRIADKLDTLLARVEAGRERLAHMPTLLSRLRQSILSAAVSGELTREWRELQAPINNGENDLLEIQKFKKSWAMNNSNHNEARRVLGFSSDKITDSHYNFELPESWTLATIEQSVLMVVDCHNKTAPYVDSGYPLIRTTNIRDGRFNQKDLKFVHQETYDYWSKRAKPESGDIIFTREAPMGEAAIIPEAAQYCLGQRTMLFKPAGELTNVKFLLFVIYSNEFAQQYGHGAVGSGVQHLRVGDVGNLILPFPPLPEQAEIVRRVELLFARVDALERQTQAAAKTYDLLTPALLQKAFRGELVPQDPNDEPASALLERIRATRAAAGEKPKRGRGASKPKETAQASAVAEPKRWGRPRKASAQAQTGGIPTVSSFEDAVRQLEAQGQQRTEGTRQASLFGDE